MGNAFGQHLEHLLFLLQEPQRLLDSKILNDAMALRIVFIGVALVAGCVVVALIIWDDARLNAPVTLVEEEEEEEDDEAIDYKALLDQSRQGNEIVSGSAEKYDWQQTEGEVDVFIPLDNDFAEAKSKEIKVHFSPKMLVVQIKDVVHIEGELYAETIPSECNWQIDQDSSPRKLWITLVKRTKTARKLHWTCVLRGDQTVDTDSLAPMVTNIDINDKDSIKKAASELRQRVRDKNRN